LEFGGRCCGFEQGAVEFWVIVFINRDGRKTMYGVVPSSRLGRAAQLDIRRSRMEFTREHQMYREIRPVDSRAQLSSYQSMYSRDLKLQIAILLRYCQT
jgi:hypothetical protein